MTVIRQSRFIYSERFASSPALNFLKKSAGRDNRRIIVADSMDIDNLLSIRTDTRAFAAFMSIELAETQTMKTAMAIRALTLPDAITSENSILLSCGISIPVSVAMKSRHRYQTISLAESMEKAYLTMSFVASFLSGKGL